MRIFLLNNIVIAILIIASNSTFAQAAENKVIPSNDNNFLIDIETGISLSQNLNGQYRHNIGNSSILGLGLKYKFTPNFQSGLSASYRGNYHYLYYGQNQGKDYIKISQKINMSALMLTSIYNLPKIHNKITPFIGIDLGISYIRPGIYSLNNIAGEHYYKGNSHVNFTGAASIGLSFNIYEKTNIIFGFRKMYFGLIKQPSGLSDQKNKGKIITNEGFAAIQLKF